jgi:hypothetical protein
VITLASGQIGALDIAVDATNVYWTNTAKFGGDGSVNKCAIGGCAGSPTSLAGGQGYTGGIAVDATSAYWATGIGQVPNGTYAVRECAIGGCGNTPTLLAGGSLDSVEPPMSMAVDATSVYWSVPLAKCSTSGCGGVPTTLATAAQLMPNNPWLALDANNVYFFSTQGVAKCPLGGCTGAPTIVGLDGFAPGDPGPTGIAVDATNVYWIMVWFVSMTPSPQWAYFVRKCSISGCGSSPTTLASGMQSMLPPRGGLAVDGTSVYWLADDALRKSPICGGGDTIVAQPADSRGRIVLDATSVYYTSPLDGTVMKATPK